VLITVWLLSGIGVWLFGRESYHIGASGLTHGVFFYLFVVSIFRRENTTPHRYLSTQRDLKCS
jgi:membrane associated rhomboid family serine protease